MDLKEILEFLDEVDKDLDEYHVVADKALKVILSFGPQTKKLLEVVCNGIIDQQAISFKRMIKKGFTREEALQLMIASLSKLNEAQLKKG